MNKENSEFLNHPHDAFVKEVLSRKENARDFFSNYLPDRIRALIDLDSLDICKDSFIEQELREYFSDLLYCLKLSGDQVEQPGYLYLLLEHKSTPQHWIAFHLLRYQVKIWELYLKQNKKVRKLPPVIPMVLYHGRTRWRVSTRFFDIILNSREELRVFIPDFSYLVYDFSPYGKDRVRGMAFLQVFLLLLKYIHHPDLLNHLHTILPPFLKDTSQSWPQLMDRLLIILHYLFNATDKDRVSVDELKEIIEENLPKDKDKEGIVMTLAEHLIQQGLQQGLQQGVEQGLQQGVEQGLQQGVEQGLREAIMDVLETRFGSIPASVKEKVAGIADRHILADLHRKAITAASVTEWEKLIPMS
ncbi:MAG: Rpn family recombination-promoting nuclease/putative transposase [bacterium]